MWEEILNLLGALENRSGCKQKLQISHVQDQISMLFLLYSASSSTQRSSFKKCQQDAGGGGSGGSHSTMLCTPLKSNNATAWQKSALISSFFLLRAAQIVLSTKYIGHFRFFAALIFLMPDTFFCFLRSCSAKLAFSTFPFT